jgi:SagB-type dehydrogenase family enzyme
MEDVGQDFMKRTKYPDFTTPDQLRGVRQPPFEMPVRKGAKIRKLPDPHNLDTRPLDVRVIIEYWEPGGFYGRSPLTLEELSYLLWCTQGVRDIVGDTVTIRNVYSCESIHPLETYLAISNVGGLAEGLYRYLPLTHRIVLERKDPDIVAHLASACMNIPAISMAAVTFIWAAVPYRATWALGSRGNRTVILDCAHACHQLIFTAETISCGVRPVDLFHDDAVTAILGINTTAQWPVYIAAVGKKGGPL